MAKALPLLLLGGAALLIMGKKKSAPKTVELPEMVAPPTKGKSGTAVWRKRQQGLVDTGYDIGRSGVDGKPGPDTRAAIREFQTAAGIDVDGLWGAQTSAAMAIALKNAIEGLGKASYGQIGNMLDKFKGAFDKFFKPGEGGPKDPEPKPIEKESVEEVYEGHPTSLEDYDKVAENILGYMTRNVQTIRITGNPLGWGMVASAKAYKREIGDRYAFINIYPSRSPFGGSAASKSELVKIMEGMRIIALERPRVTFWFEIVDRTGDPKFTMNMMEFMGGNYHESAESLTHKFESGTSYSKMAKEINSDLLGYITWLEGERESLKA